MQENGFIIFDVMGNVDKLGDNVWVALGLNAENDMNNTSVTDCIYLSGSGNVTIQQSHNYNHTNYADDSQLFLGLNTSSFSGSLADGRLSCSFERAIDTNGSDYAISIDEPLFLMIGVGKANDQGVKLKHQNIPLISPIRLNFSRYENIGVTRKIPFLIKAHACLMVIAWMWIATISIVFARHLKLLKKKILGNDVSFLVHRTGMMLVLLFSAVGLGCIISYKKSISQAKVIHAWLGIFVLLLVLINPIMALFRPAQHHPKRMIFNRAHFILGTTGHLVSGATIFLGVKMPQLHLDDWAGYVVVTSLCLRVSFDILLLCYNQHRKSFKAGMRTYSRFEDGDYVESYDEDKPAKKLTRKKVAACIVYLALTTVLTGALLYQIIA